MSYKSLLTVLTAAETATAPLAQVAALAEEFGAHADALCLGVDRTQTGYYYAGANAMVLQETLARAQEEAEAIQAGAVETLQRAGVPFATDSGVAQIADLGRHVARHARFSDLVVLGKPYGKEKRAEAEPIVESALFEGRAPVLVVPDKGEPLRRPKTVLVAWNESIEAMTAIRRSLPFLTGADLVRIAVIDPPQHGPERSDPGGMLAQMLSRHGVTCEIDVLSKTLTRVSDILNRHAADTAADLIVMGAYGHSRFREAILGGATRNMLEQAAVPVLMAH
ncbi:universal stress protein [Leisingera aquaemixtae]|jgi:nucleotide-binding universal stress UspA family protein|uniref:Universal stress protein n=1 Tax=Leisingera aquaemixtae TaxID=1396826 RepID=A0A0P1H7Y2_9RHOB|nr:MULTISPECIES: universal stress protein [Leisingera]QDI76854.1 universal stress protein [Leisingera aquaemixtae]UWQ37970.1 universal stress protein [Leisingera aquaemixtae]UWQ42093.1 universal stress protein [Leisingera aquaemixtae]CUH98900.1 Universal stress protein family protein [Leisingera aquaemixtae]